MKTLACDLGFSLTYYLNWVTEQNSFLINGKPFLVYLISSVLKSVGLTCIWKDKVYVAYLNSEEFGEESSAICYSEDPWEPSVFCSKIWASELHK